jgi:hypothetical protein
MTSESHKDFMYISKNGLAVWAGFHDDEKALPEISPIDPSFSDANLATPPPPRRFIPSTPTVKMT